MSIHLEGLEDQQTMTLIVKDENAFEVNLAISTGIALCFFRGNSGSTFLQDFLDISTGSLAVDSTRFIRAVASAWPASLANDGPANNAGWAVNGVSVLNQGQTVRVSLAVRDTDGWILRVGYRMDALYHISEPTD